MPSATLAITLSSILATFGQLFLPEFSVARFSYFTASTTVLNGGVLPCTTFPDSGASAAHMAAVSPHSESSTKSAFIELSFTASTWP